VFSTECIQPGKCWVFQKNLNILQHNIASPINIKVYQLQLLLMSLRYSILVLGHMSDHLSKSHRYVMHIPGYWKVGCECQINQSLFYLIWEILFHYIIKQSGHNPVSNMGWICTKSYHSWNVINSLKSLKLFYINCIFPQKCPKISVFWFLYLQICKYLFAIFLNCNKLINSYLYKLVMGGTFHCQTYSLYRKI
jgi:hypothetical protein